ncbi:hypothetical protein GAYE_SCF04G2464 [Galdieria yellowstonensis]|uniref:Tubulin-specific chaperone D n=1 Tax=Galdieria yellowstonensis TaxID=3028027 RepID=A0AAV9IB68_9RHOD|nr:hypothetical protein GAYE_SCF04G2464 [Galdieria yellowstonensis]
MQQTLDELLKELSWIDFCNVSWPIEDFAKQRGKKYDELQKWCRACDSFQDFSQLLDRQLSWLITELAFKTKSSLELLRSFLTSCYTSQVRDEDLTYFCSPFIALYHVSKVRGFKCIAKLFPSQVDDFFTLLREWKIFQEIQTLENFPWQVAYVLLLWLSKLSLLPFSMEDFEESVESSDQTASIADIIVFAKKMLSASSKIQYSAAYFLATILTRQDMQNQSRSYLEDFVASAEQGDRIDISETFQIGNLRTIAWMFEFGTKSCFDGMTERLLSTFLKVMNSTTNITIRHLCVKNIQRLALLFLPKKGASWLRRRRFIKIHSELSKEPAERITHESMNEDAVDEETGRILASIMETLLQLLDDKHTVTRYSVAKGIGRICMRLPKSFSDEVLQVLLSHVENGVRKHYGYLWHGACLTLAECARRGIFGDEHLKVIVKFVSEALRYDFARGSVHAGSQVRDAACYVCWAFARSYHSSIPLVFLKELIMNIVCVACTDRELNCRRAAAAALQELVGRTGVVSQGISVITTADYFTLSDLSDSYLKVLPEIAFLDDEWYRQALIDELVQRKIRHWDPAIRQLASSSLAIVIAKDFVNMRDIFETTLQQLVVGIYSEEPDVRHGSLLAVHKLLHSVQELVNLETVMKPYYSELVRFIQEQIDNTSLDFIQIAACQLLACFFEGRFFCEPEFIKKTVDLMRSENKNVQDAAASAFGSACSFLCWQRENATLDSAVEQCVVDMVTKMIHSIRWEQNSKMTGFLKALGCVPVYILNQKITQSDETFKEAILALFLKFGKRPDNFDIPGTLEEDNDQVVELKVTCIESLTHFVTHILKCTNVDSILCDTEMAQVVQFLLGGMDDYTTGSRGDIGSWVRMTSMECFGKLMITMNDHTKYRVEPLLQAGIHRLVRNCFERIDKTRVLAAETLKLLYDNLEPCFIQKFALDVLRDILNNFEPALFLDYGRLFQNGIAMVKRNGVFFLAVLFGFLAAFGGNGSQNKEAQKAMESFLKDEVHETPETITMLLKNLFVILTVDSKTRRNLIPIIRMISLILETTKRVESEAILEELLVCLIQRMKGSKDINLLLAFTEMLVEASVHKSTIGHIANQRLMFYLIHPFAKVRQFVSDRLQVQLLTYEDYFVELMGEENYQQAIQILEQVEWDKTSPKKLKEHRNRLCTAFGLDLPQ